MAVCICSCPKLTASNIVFSDNSLASDSTINTPSEVPAITKSKVDSSIWLIVGFKTKSPPISPTRAAPIGPKNGTPEIVKAADAPIMATISGLVSISCDKTVHITCVSHLNSLGNKGLIGLSISLLTSVSFSDGRPSRLKNPPGIFPAANAFS